MLSRGIISTWGRHCCFESSTTVGLVSSRVLQQQVCHKLSWQGCGLNNCHCLSQSAAPRGFAVAAEPADTRSSRTSSDLSDSSTTAGSAAAAGQAPQTARRRRRKLFNSVGKPLKQTEQLEPAYYWVHVPSIGAARGHKGDPKMAGGAMAAAYPL